MWPMLGIQVDHDSSAELPATVTVTAEPAITVAANVSPSSGISTRRSVLLLRMHTQTRNRETASQ
jgi:hypothetical protein